MKLGVHIGYWGMGLTRDDQLEIVREAERLGYDSVWTPRAAQREVVGGAGPLGYAAGWPAGASAGGAATTLGWTAGPPKKIKTGSPFSQTPARSPAMTAMTAATLDQLSNGRMLLGIGSS